MSYETYDYDYVRSQIGYNKETGQFWWLISPAKNIKAGNEAGTIKSTRKSKTGKPTSYRYIKIGTNDVPAARVAWMLAHGEWPKARILFKDGNPLNLALSNLELGASVLMDYDVTEMFERRAYLKSHRDQYPRNWKDWDLQRNFGIGLHEYGKMLVSQNGKCAICKQEETEKRNGNIKSLAVDHNHSTGKVRGLLCSSCNTALGKFKEDVEILKNAISYLQSHLETDSSVVE